MKLIHKDTVASPSVVQTVDLITAQKEIKKIQLIQ